MKRRKKKTKASPKNIMFYIISITIGTVFGGSLGVLSMYTRIPFWWMIVSIFIAWFFIVNIHEFGHFVAGKICGYQLMTYRISMLSFDNQNGRMKFSIKKTKGISGLCAMMPLDHSIKKFGWYMAGGILANLLTGFGAIIVHDWLRNPYTFNANLLMVFGFLSVLIALGNMLPMKQGSMASDGKLMWAIFFKSKEADQYMAKVELQTRLNTGMRPRELDIAYNDDAPFDLSTCILHYNRAKDMFDTAALDKYAGLMEEHLTDINSFQLPSVHYYLLYNALIQGNQDKVAEYYKLAKRHLKWDRDANGYRVKAYYTYYAKQDAVAALQYCNKGLKVVPQYPSRGFAKMEYDLLTRLKTIIKEGNA